MRNAALVSWVVLVPGMLLLALLADKWDLASGWGDTAGIWALVSPPLAVFAGGCAVAIAKRDGRYVRGTYIGLLVGLATMATLFMVFAAVIGQES